MSDTAESRQKNPRTSETVLQRITAIRAPRLLRGLELALTVFALCVGVVNLIVDVIYAFLDPRIKAQYR